MTSNNPAGLTEKELDAIFWAISLAQASYEGWSAEEKGPEVIQDLKALARAESKMWVNSQTRAKWLESLEA